MALWIGVCIVTKTVDGTKQVTPVVRVHVGAEDGAMAALIQGAQNSHPGWAINAPWVDAVQDGLILEAAAEIKGGAP